MVDAVDRGLVADQVDTGYALMLATEITERGGDLLAAEALAGRAVEAYRVHGDPDYGYARACRAGLLLRLGRADEAMAELTALRPKLSEDADAVSYLSETLEEGGRADIAEQWLTAALPVALQRQQELGPSEGSQPTSRPRRWCPCWSSNATGYAATWSCPTMNTMTSLTACWVYLTLPTGRGDGAWHRLRPGRVCPGSTVD